MSNGKQTKQIVIVTDGWHPQVTGVVTTLANVKPKLEKHGHVVHMIVPDPMKHFIKPWLPGHPEIPLAVGPKPGQVWVDRELDALRRAGKVDQIYIATPEGPLGLTAALYCRHHNLNFTTGFHTRFDDFTSALRLPVISWASAKYGHEYLKWAHSGAYRTLILNEGMVAELEEKGFKNLVLWTRGVDTELFKPGESRVYDGLPRPIFLSVGRISYEKGLNHIPSGLPGTTVFVGTGPQFDDVKAKYPKALFAGVKRGEELADYYRGADVFMFPSLTDTFGNVQIEALSCGLPIAARPNPASARILSVPGIGVMNNDFETACREAIRLRENGCAVTCRQHVLENYNGWERTARILEDNLIDIEEPRRRRLIYSPIARGATIG